MVSIDELLEEMDAILDKAMMLPLSGGKALIDVDRMRELIDDMRLHMPNEVKQAREVVAGRNDIIAQARKEAESITRKAEDRARALISDQEILRRATIAANETTVKAQTRAREIRKGAVDYSENIMRATEEIISQKLTELRQARQSLRSSTRQDTNAIQGGQQPVQLQLQEEDIPDRRRRAEQPGDEA